MTKCHAVEVSSRCTLKFIEIGTVAKTLHWRYVCAFDIQCQSFKLQNERESTKSNNGFQLCNSDSGNEKSSTFVKKVCLAVTRSFSLNNNMHVCIHVRVETLPMTWEIVHLTEKTFLSSSSMRATLWATRCLRFLIFGHHTDFVKMVTGIWPSFCFESGSSDMFEIVWWSVSRPCNRETAWLSASVSVTSSVSRRF